MPWNPPGSGNSGDERRPPRPRGTGPGGIGPLFDRLRGLFGGGSPLRWVALALGLFLVFSSFVLITEQERGVVLRFGRAHRLIEPGPHFKLPWPIERVIKVNATQSNAYSETVPVLTRDGNMVSVEINVQYRIGDPQTYLFGSRDADAVLQQAAQSAVRELVGRSDLDTVLGERSALTVTVRDRLQQSLDAYRTGLVVTELNLPNARPPEEVKDAFDEAQRASADKATAINEAQAYAKKVVPEARGEAARIRTVSEGYKTAVIARARGDAERFSLLVEQYKQAPEVTRKRLWLETVQQVLAENRTIVGADSRQLFYVPMGGTNARGTGAAGAPTLPLDRLAPAISAPDAAEAREGRTPRAAGREEPTR
ncbi:MAG TPA: FtsH protease activity modulator HflK [Lysobacter sp.]|nr:FtsH protease activity modulator HflK [Lysobacter sp.]